MKFDFCCDTCRHCIDKDKNNAFICLCEYHQQWLYKKEECKYYIEEVLE